MKARVLFMVGILWVYSHGFFDPFEHRQFASHIVNGIAEHLAAARVDGKAKQKTFEASAARDA
jgi:hypothetical protein